MAVDTVPSILSANDKRVLNALFDPETLPSSVAKSKDASAIDTSLPPHPTIRSDKLNELESQQQNIIREIDVQSTLEAIDLAISKLNETISQWPNYGSAYTNRAQLHRLKIESTLPSDSHIFTAPEAAIQPLFTDLARAIHLSLPASSPTAPVSPYAARTLRTAYTHRAYLYLKAVETGTELQGLAKSELEELASKDFAAAARYGDEVAREMSVRTNPYAKMCGAIVRNALMEERREAGM